MKRVLVACEYSGRVRDAFAGKGWDAWSCDLLEASDTPALHLSVRERDALDDEGFARPEADRGCARICAFVAQ